MFWDTWLAQKIGKARAQWESKRRRTRNEAGDAEETNATQDIQLPEQLQIQRPEAVKRRTQAGSSTDRIVSGESNAEPGRANSQRSTGLETIMDPAPVTDVKTYNLSLKLGISLIVAFSGKSGHFFFLRVSSRLTLSSIPTHSVGRSRYCHQPTIGI